MSFSSDTKDELCKIQNRSDCCDFAEGYGLLLFSKCFSQKPKKLKLENGNAARLIAGYAASLVGVVAELSTKLRRSEKKAYELDLGDNSRYFYEIFGHDVNGINLRINRDNLKCDQCISSFLRGVFVACGAITDPNKKYDLEFIVPYKMLSEDLLLLINSLPMGIEASVFERKGSYIVYTKDSSKIEDLLTFIGASNASMELMQVKMYREAINDINRKSNFETANMDKTISAAARQTAAIAMINDTVGLDSLPDELKELAVLRLENPDMSLKDLGEKLNLSRSSVNYKIQKILKIGEKQRERISEIIKG